MSAVRRRVFCDVHDGKEKVVVHAVQDVEPVLKANRRAMNANGSGTASLWQNREWVLVGRIPLAVLDQLEQKGLKFTDPDDFKIIKRMLNSSDWEGFRTAPGRI